MEHVDHLPFIVASYLAAFAIVGALIGWVSFDFRAQRRAITDLESRGVTRRSGPGRSDVLGGQAGEQA